MYCKNCGTKLDDNVRFCYSCGTQVNGPAPQKPTPVVQNYSTPTPPKKQPKKRKGLMAIVAIVAVIAILATTGAVFAASGLFGSDSSKVAAAFSKSYKAFTDAVDQMGLTDIGALTESKKVSEELSLWIDEIDGASSMSGLGLRLALDSSLPDRNIGMVLTPFWGSADLLSLQMKLDDAELYVGSPEFTGGNYYMINTETICRDLENMGADLGEAAQLSINIFDVLEDVQELYGENKEMAQAVKNAVIETLKTVDVKKSGNETIDVNGIDLDCTAYDVVIPEAALHQFLTSVEEAYQNAQNPDAYGHLLESMGIPADVIEEMKAAIVGASDDVSNAFGDIHTALNEVGDMELDIYICDGYVVAMVYENTIDGITMAMNLSIGGGTNYLDNISFNLNMDEEGYRITSTGNHTGRNNTFTDLTVLEYVYDGQVTPLVQIDSSYAPKQVEDNFSLAVKSDGVTLELAGQLTCDKDFINLYLNKVSVSEYGEKLAVIGMEFSIGKYEGDHISIQNYQTLADMTQAELMAVANELTKNATAWAMNLDSDIQSKMMGIAYSMF